MLFRHKKRHSVFAVSNADIKTFRRLPITKTAIVKILYFPSKGTHVTKPFSHIRTFRKTFLSYTLLRHDNGYRLKRERRFLKLLQWSITLQKRTTDRKY